MKGQGSEGNVIRCLCGGPQLSILYAVANHFRVLAALLPSLLSSSLLCSPPRLRRRRHQTLAALMRTLATAGAGWAKTLPREAVGVSAGGTSLQLCSPLSLSLAPLAAARAKAGLLVAAPPILPLR